MNKYLALIHHPIINKRGDKVTTSVTNLDIHDIARSCRTFGFHNYFIVTPIEKQAKLIDEILGFWNEDFANDYNPDRHDALSFIKVSESFEKAVEEIEKKEGSKPLIVGTGANFKEFDGNVQKAEEVANDQGKSILIIFGTGWGLHSEILEKVDFFLDPIFGTAKDGYNHLSVRSAVAIYTSQFQ